MFQPQNQANNHYLPGMKPHLKVKHHLHMTGDNKELLQILRIKDNVDHAGHFLPLPIWKDNTSYPNKEH